jgi:predicted acyltransferase
MASIKNIKHMGTETLAAKNEVSGEVVNPPMPLRRIASVDVYRGFVMLLMMGEVLAFSTVAHKIPDSTFWNILSFNQSHVEWTWLGLHDMIQPSFTFLVGVVLPFSIESRKNKGATKWNLLQHTIKRSIILILLGIFLRSLHKSQTYFTFEDTLTQIGLGYTFLVILGFYSQRVQVTALAVILIGYWLLFALYPLPGPGFDYASAGVTANWEHNLHGFAAHWNKNTNVAWAFDRWFLNLFPRESVFLNNGGGYSTLSFIPTLGTMILGLFAGNTLNSTVTPQKKVRVFIIAGISLIAISVLLHITGINPIVKRIWTPAWTLFSGGICFLFLAFFYQVIDVSGKKNWSFFLMVIGANSIAAYFMADGGVRAYISQALTTHLGGNYSGIFGVEYTTLVAGGLALLVEWLILYWMYKRKIFIKI